MLEDFNFKKSILFVFTIIIFKKLIREVKY